MTAAQRAHNFLDLTGQRFGRLTVLALDGVAGKHTFWRCRCDCGSISVPASNKLRGGRTLSCGCLKASKSAERLRATHRAAGPLQEVLSHERLLRLVHYDRTTGLFTSRVIRPKCPLGSVIGSRRSDGYIELTIDRRKYQAHRLAWFYMHGVWPFEIDHRDLNRSNNTLGNLREAARGDNNANHPMRCDNSVGFKGVYRVKSKTALYAARITVRGIAKYLGCFRSPEEAHDAYVAAATDAYGEYARAS